MVRSARPVIKKRDSPGLTEEGYVLAHLSPGVVCMKQSLRVAIFAFVLSSPLAAQATGGMSSMSSSTANLDVVRAALAKYKDPVAALGDGYLSTLVCMQFPASTEPGHMAMPAGGMGVHF